MEKIISVIVPVYNTEKELDKCVLSIINQTMKNIEIIFVNDGSTDKSSEICKHYMNKDSRIIYINQKHKGISCARNQGISAASGRCIAFVDSDDYIELDMMETLYKNMICSDAEISMCGFQQIDEKGKILQIYSPCEELTAIEDNEILKNSLFSEHKNKSINVALWNKIYKIELFNGVHFPGNKVYEDIYITPIILKNAKKLCMSSEVKYNYLKRKDSITNSSVSESIFDYSEAALSRYQYVTHFSGELESLARCQLLQCLIDVLIKVECDSTFSKRYKKEKEEIYELIKSYNIYDCNLHWIFKKLIELLKADVKKFNKLLLKIASRNDRF